MIKLKTQLAATVSQNELETMITDMINTQLGAGSHITKVNFVWAASSVIVTGIQQSIEELPRTECISKPVSEIPFDVIDAIVKQPTVTLQEEQPKSPFTAIVNDNVFTKVAAAKEAIGISTESSFPSVTIPNKFQLQ